MKAPGKTPVFSLRPQQHTVLAPFCLQSQKPSLLRFSVLLNLESTPLHRENVQGCVRKRTQSAFNEPGRSLRQPGSSVCARSWGWASMWPLQEGTLLFSLHFPPPPRPGFSQLHPWTRNRAPSEWPGRIPRKAPPHPKRRLQFGAVSLLRPLIEWLEVKIARFHFHRRRWPCCLLLPWGQGQVLRAPLLHPAPPFLSPLLTPTATPDSVPPPSLRPWHWIPNGWSLLGTSVSSVLLRPTPATLPNQAAYSPIHTSGLAIAHFLFLLFLRKVKSTGQRQRLAIKMITIRKMNTAGDSEPKPKSA